MPIQVNGGAKVRGRVVFRFIIGIVMFFWACFCHCTISLQTIKERSQELDWVGLEKGDIVSNSLAEREVNKAALAVVVAVKLKASARAVMDQLKKTSPNAETISIDVESAKSIESSFERYRLRSNGVVDIEWFKKPRADGTFNATREELSVLKTASLTVESLPDGTANFEPMQQAVQQLLANRLTEYLEGGLSKVSPYYVNGRNIFPGEYLADSLRPLRILKQKEAEFYKAFVHYPNYNVDGNVINEFYVVREEEGGKPVTSLKHWMVSEQDQAILIAERKFYISHSLDAMHTLILALQSGEFCYLFMMNLSFTQKVAGIGSFVAHKVGRSKVKENILPLFQSLKEHFSR